MHGGETVYLIGNGPSLNKIDIEKLRDKNTISFNRAYIAYEDWGFYPTHFMIADPVVMSNTKDAVNDLIKQGQIKSFYFDKKFKSYFGNNLDQVHFINFNRKIWERGYKWGKTIKNMGLIANVGATAVPILKSLGYKRIIILGTDCNYEEHNIKGVSVEVNEDSVDRRIVYKSEGDSDPNHFRPDYFGKGTEYSKPQTQNHYKGWQYISRKYKSKGMEILLCSPGSRLSNLFPEISFEEAIEKY